MSVLLLLLSACSGCSPYACYGSPAPEKPPATLNVPPPDPTLKPAPTRNFYGLTLGESGEPQIRAWLAERKLTCRETPSVRRTTFRYECGEGLTPALLPDRKIAGQLSSLLLVRVDSPEAGSASNLLSHASSLRRYSLPERAAEDYDAAVSVLTSTFGAPKRGAPVDLTKLSGPLVRYATLWSFSDLQVTLTLMRMGGDYWSVSERWDQPGIELAQPERAPQLPPGFDRSKCKDPFCFDQPGMAPPGMRDPFGFDKKKDAAPATPAP